MKPTTAVIFDLFGTLVPPVDRHMYRASAAEVASALDVDAALVTALWMENDAFRESLTTTGSSTEAQVDLTCDALGIARSPELRRLAAARHLDAHRAWLTPRPSSLETLRRLRADRLRVGLISNCSVSVPELWNDTAFGPLVDCALFSCLEGVAKPARVLYERVCNGLDVDPTTCIYVDDGIDELRGAEATGMLAVWLTTTDVDEPEWLGHRVSSPKEILAVVKAA